MAGTSTTSTAAEAVHEDGLEPVIGLEIHVQLQTATKMFCGCELRFGGEPNTRTCPVCLGMPGTLPYVNVEAIHLGILMGLAFGSTIAPSVPFARKNYFYPDLPKGYQISQLDQPLCDGGRIGDVRLERVHLEEDAAKLVHAGGSGRIGGSTASVVDFNRGGTPLAEIVTRPDIRSAQQAADWLRVLRTTIRQLGVSDGNMEEGSLRCDANISLRPAGTDELGTKTELKNMNSFRFIEQGITAEIARQREVIASGGAVEQATMHFDPRTGALTTMRSKEAAHDYRYFPEPDLPPVEVTPAMLERAAEALPELPLDREARYAGELGLHPEAARLLAFRRELGELFEATLVARAGVEGGDAVAPAALANWIGNQLVPRLETAEAREVAPPGDGTDPTTERAVAPRDVSSETPDTPAGPPVEPAALVRVVALVESGAVTRGGGEQVLEALLAEGGSPDAIVEREGLAAIGAGADGEDQLTPIVQAALDANPDVVEKLRAGNMKPIGKIVGHVMKETRGRADGGEVTRIARELVGA